MMSWLSTGSGTLVGGWFWFTMCLRLQALLGLAGWFALGPTAKYVNVSLRKL